MFLRHVTHAPLPSTFVLYATYRYGWDATAVSLALAGVGVGSLVVQGAVVAPFVRRFDDRARCCGVWALFAVGIVLPSLWGLSRAASQGLMTRHVGPTEQGRLQGLDGSLRGIADLIGPGLFTLTFAYSIAPGHELPGAPFLLAALLQLAAIALAWSATRVH